jgi:membrane protein implicated in regulation of membrane protease activity
MEPVMSPEWWHWAVVGIVLILAELAVPAFVLVWFGLGALLVALVVAVMDIGVTAQLAVWLVVSLALVVLWFRVFKPGQHKTRIGMADADIIGEIGLLTHDVAPFQKGEVRFQKPILGAESWECIADEAISSGARVKVVSVEGSMLKVGVV